MGEGARAGGSSSINGNVFVRGDPAEFDSWSSLGCQGWSWEDMLPYFKRMETYADGEPDTRGKDGPINVTQLKNFDSSPMPISMPIVRPASSSSTTTTTVTMRAPRIRNIRHGAGSVAAAPSAI